MPGPRYLLGWAGMPDPLSLLEGGYVGGGYVRGWVYYRGGGSAYVRKQVYQSVGISRGYTDHYQGRGQAIRPTATFINIHEPLI